MTLAKLTVEDFKRVKCVELDLADVNILVGSNSSGKSSILQAIHLACCVMRQADRVEAGKTSTVGIDALDYLPTNSYKLLGHKSAWGNKDGTAASKVSLLFLRENVPFTVSCTLRSARNAGISITGTVPSELADTLRKKRAFFSAYIPGISGIPNKEEKKSKKVILKACSYGDSNIILRNVLLLLKNENPDNITQIEEWISAMAEPLTISVQHSDDEDLAISCNITISNDVRPIELVGAGYVQLIQIFAYILLFKPGILLIDEPDIHLHPTVQEKLASALADVAGEKNLKILITTHSPFVIRGASASANVYWLNSGKVESTDRRAAELALGWGAFGKKIILVSEDSNNDLLKKIISQWPGLERNVTFLPGRGFKSVTTPDQAAELSDALGGKYKILIHRDRDSLTDNEVTTLQQRYADKGATVWLPDFADVEAFFCSAAFLQSFVGCTEDEALHYVEQILLKQAVPIREQFDKQRIAHNEELYKQGGSPISDEVWNSFQTRCLKGAKGKFVFKQLKNAIPGNVFSEDAILKHTLTAEVATSLKSVLEHLSA